MNYNDDDETNENSDSFLYIKVELRLWLGAERTVTVVSKLCCVDDGQD